MPGIALIRASRGAGDRSRLAVPCSGRIVHRSAIGISADAAQAARLPEVYARRVGTPEWKHGAVRRAIRTNGVRRSHRSRQGESPHIATGPTALSASIAVAGPARARFTAPGPSNSFTRRIGDGDIALVQTCPSAQSSRTSTDREPLATGFSRTQVACPVSGSETQVRNYPPSRFSFLWLPARPNHNILCPRIPKINLRLWRWERR